MATLASGNNPVIQHSITPLRKLVEPEVVATSPYPIKSRVPVCCGFGSVKMVLAAGVAPALATISTSCLYYWTTRAAESESVNFGLTKSQAEAKICLQAGMKRTIRLFVLVAINAIGLSTGLGRDVVEVESHYVGDGTFQYTLRTLEDPFIAQIGFGQLLPDPFTNYLSSVTPPHWTNYFYQGQWTGIMFDASGPQPRLN